MLSLVVLGRGCVFAIGRWSDISLSRSRAENVDRRSWRLDGEKLERWNLRLGLLDFAVLKDQ